MSKKNNGRIENDSWFIPFEMPGDSFFDHNHDGKLTGWETLQRDAYHYEMSQKFEEAKKNDKPSYSRNYKVSQSYNDSPNEPKKTAPEETGSAGVTLLAIFSAIFILIFSTIVAFNSDGFFTQFSIFAGGISLSIYLLNKSGNLK